MLQWLAGVGAALLGRRPVLSIDQRVLRPGDVLVLSFRGQLDREEARRIVDEIVGEARDVRMAVVVRASECDIRIENRGVSSGDE